MERLAHTGSKSYTCIVTSVLVRDIVDLCEDLDCLESARSLLGGMMGVETFGESLLQQDGLLSEVGPGIEGENRLLAELRSSAKRGYRKKVRYARTANKEGANDDGVRAR